MKQWNLFNWILILSVAFSFQSCLKDTCEGTQTFVQFTPVYKTLDEIRTDIQILGPQELVNPGKIYYYGDYLLINERREGIHVINNADSENPTKVAFIKIPGNVDMAIKENVLYADNYIDLLAVDFSNPELPSVLSRTENVFNSITLHEELGHLVYYDETEITRTIDCNDPRWGWGWFWEEDVFFANADAAIPASGGGISTQSSGGQAAPAGIGGSFARFTIYDCFLYTVDEFNLSVFDVTDKNNPSLNNTVNVGWGIETIFPYQDKLFIGSESGLFIFDNSNPSNPSYASEFQHARACDPVFVQNDIAYVTLRDGTFCEGFINQLDIIDVEDIFNPRLLASHSMENPHGLSVKGDHLFLCDGAHGLKVFDVSDINDLNRTDKIDGFHTYDVIAIPNKDVILVIGDDGFYQYDSSNPNNLKELSKIEVIR